MKINAMDCPSYLCIEMVRIDFYVAEYVYIPEMFCNLAFFFLKKNLFYCFESEKKK